MELLGEHVLLAWNDGYSTQIEGEFKHGNSLPFFQICTFAVQLYEYKAIEVYWV